MRPFFLAKNPRISYSFHMSLRNQFEGIASWFKGPNTAAQRDVAHNYSEAGSKRVMQMVMAAMSKLGVSSHTPRNYLFGASKPSPAANPESAPKPRYKG